MVKVTVEYRGDLHCVAKHGPSGAALETDAPVDNQGKGEAFSPTDLVGAALGSCMATIMGIYARANGIPLEGMRLEVTKEMTPSPRAGSPGSPRKSGCPPASRATPPSSTPR